MQKVEAVIFDLDNTLVNRKLAFATYTKSFIDRFIVITDEQHASDIVEYIRTADRDGYRKKRELYEEILVTFDMKNANTTVDDLLQYWFSQFYQCTVLMDGALDVLHYLKAQNIKLGLITNGSEHAQNLKLDQVKLRDYFDSIIVSDEVKLKKPDKRIYELALERLAVDRKYTWYVGDHPINDISGALGAGLNAIWLEGFMTWPNNVIKPCYVVRSLHQIKEILSEKS